jgi:hypothetical protein
MHQCKICQDKKTIYKCQIKGIQLNSGSQLSQMITKIEGNHLLVRLDLFRA